MPVILNRTQRRFTFAKAQYISDFGLPEPPIDWRSEGRGRDGYILTRRPDTIGASPAPGVTQIIQRWILNPFDDIYTRYFAAIPVRFFERVTVSFDATNIFIDLNLEE